MTKSDDLKLARLESFDLIPRYLLEQVKGANWTPELLYEWGPALGQSPLQLIYGMTGPDKTIYGLLWATVNPVVDGIVLNVISVDPAYQDHVILKKATGFLRGKLKELGLLKLYATTTRPRAAERMGWVRTNMIMMEA